MDKLITLEQMKRLTDIPQIKERFDMIHEILSKGRVIDGKWYWRMSDVREWLYRVKGAVET